MEATVKKNVIGVLYALALMTVLILSLIEPSDQARYLLIFLPITFGFTLVGLGVSRFISRRTR